jgi:thiamine kinase-like enzyme
MREFDQFTDAEIMRIKFQRLFPSFAQGALQVTDCEVLDTRLTPSSPSVADGAVKSFMSALYRLNLFDSYNGEISQQMVYAKAYQDNRSHAEFEKSIRSYHTGEEAMPAFAHLPELDTVVWCFPNDPALPHLGVATDPEKARRHLPYPMMPPGFDRQDSIGEVKISIVNYSPEIRCFVKFELSSNTSDESITVFGKIFPDERGRDVYGLTEELWKVSEKNPGFFKIPRPLSYDEKMNIVWEKGVHGVRLLECFNSWSCRNLLQAIAKGLAGLHAASAPTVNHISVDSHVEETRKKVSKLSKAFPKLRAALRNVEQIIRNRAATLTPAAETLIHGDFQIQRLALSGDRIAIVDLDSLSYGDPLQDVANFVVDLYGYPYDAELIEGMKTALIEAYVIAMRGEIANDRLSWHLGVQFISRAYQCYLQQKHSPEDLIENYLGYAQRELGTLTTSRLSGLRIAPVMQEI